MCNGVIRTLQNWSSCAKNRGSPLQHQQNHNLELFQPNRPLEFMAMEILGTLSKTDWWNRLRIEITDWYRKLTKTVTLAKKTASVTADSILTYWVYKFWIPYYLLIENRSDFIFTFFGTICYAFGINHCTRPTSTHRQMARLKFIMNNFNQIMAVCNRAPTRLGPLYLTTQLWK